jgi:hypothetical protein
MKVIIPTKNRADIITTHLIFGGFDYYVLVHDEEQFEAYASRRDIPEERLCITNVPGDTFGLTRQREWACENLVEEGEWFVFADDNVKHYTVVPEPFYSRLNLPVDTSPSFKKVYDRKADVKRFFEACADTIEHAEAVGAHLCGFATVDNFYFRGKKFRDVGYVIGKSMLWHNVPYDFDHTVSMEDFKHTCENLLRYGAVTINNYIFPVAGHYQKGGMGTYDERVPQRLKDCQAMMEMYPGLVRYKERKDFVPKTDLALRFHSTEQVEKWRKEMGVIE